MISRFCFLSVLSLFFFNPILFAKTSAVEVQVEVTEIDNRKAHQLGIDWISGIRVSEQAAAGLLSIGRVTRPDPLRADIRFLSEQGAAELLANPNLLTDSGTTAHFRAGGEIPYLTTSSLGAAHVQFKPYGVGLKIKPKILENDRIEMDVGASVSAPDLTNGVTLSGNTVPALLERQVESHITLRSGATMTLAGLVQTVKENSTKGIPFLRKIPFLGALFRWKRQTFRKTTIVIFVTPKIIQT